MFSMMLALQGYRTEIASNGLEALARVHREPPDLIFLDVVLPGIDGLSVCREIRSTTGLEDIPIILVSARGHEEDMQAGLAAGADAYLAKPVGLDEVLRAIRNVFSRRGLTAL